MGQRILAFVCCALIQASHATERSHQAVAEFKRENPCPATGRPRGACPGWIVDHITPLCDGGADHKDNMQWQTVAEAKLKDRDEAFTCRLKRKR